MTDESQRPEAQDLEAAFFDKPALSTQEEGLIKEYVEARDTLSFWDHTGDADHKIDGDPELALQQMENMKRLIESIPESAENSKAQKQLQDIDSLINGFRYRQEHQLGGLQRQRENARKELYQMAKEPGAMGRLQKIINELGGQSDAKDFYDQIQAEYHQVLDIMEEASESGDESFTLDTDELHKRLFTHNQGLSFVSTIGGLAERYQGLQKIKRNIELLQPLADIQQVYGSDEKLSNPTFDAIKNGVPEIESKIVDGMVAILGRVTNAVRKEKAGGGWKFELADTHADISNMKDRLEAVIADMEEELEGSEIDQEQIDSLTAQDDELTQKIEAKRRQQQGAIRKFGVGVLQNVGVLKEDPSKGEISKLESQRASIRSELRRLQKMSETMSQQREDANRIIGQIDAFLASS